MCQLAFTPGKKHQEERKEVVGVTGEFNRECGVVRPIECRVREETGARKEVGMPTT
jgi:hypothetical protein